MFYTSIYNVNGNVTSQGPKGSKRGTLAATRRIQVGALVLQTFLSESLREEALSRKTFRLELNEQGLPEVGEGICLQIIGRFFSAFSSLYNGLTVQICQ